VGWAGEIRSDKCPRLCCQDYRKRRVASTVVTAAGRAFDQDSTDQWVAQDLIPAVFITDGAVSRRFPAFDVVNM